MTQPSLIEQLTSLTEIEGQRQFLAQHAPQLGEDIADALKAQADRYLRADITLSLETAELLIEFAELKQNPLFRALGLLAEANARAIGLGEVQEGLALYDEAAGIYEADGQPVRMARSQIGKLVSLARLGRYDEALEAGIWAGRILEQHACWQPLADLTLNLGNIHGSLGQDVESLAHYDRARELYVRIGEAGEFALPWVDHDRAVALRNLGEFDDSLHAAKAAEEMLNSQGQPVEAARARQSIALTYLVLGRYNEALAAYDQVRDIFQADGRHRDLILVDLYITDCLLQLRRYSDVLDRCRDIHAGFAVIGAGFEDAQALLNEAVAYAGLDRYPQAMASLLQAREVFAAEGNDVWVAISDLERAALLLRQGSGQECLDLAQACAATFETFGLPVHHARARLVAARACASLTQPASARQFAGDALSTAQEHDIPSLQYQARHLLGRLAAAEGGEEQAQAEYRCAIKELERLRGRLMVEYRADFLEDKQAVYEDAVLLSLGGNRPAEALAYAERAKSQALLDMLAYRLDLHVRARRPEDLPLVEELELLRRERDRLFRRWAGSPEAEEGAWEDIERARREARRQILSLETGITDLWHRILVRNADYARDAALWQVRAEPVQADLPESTLLVEYYIARGEVLAFLVSRDEVRVQRLACGLDKLQPLLQQFWLNVRTVPAMPERVADLARNAKSLLGQLYDHLYAPLAAGVESGKRLIVVPHGPLHYLPFHALHDGDAYLVERHEISYLPVASILPYCGRSDRAPSGALALGHSYGGRLPHALHEARSVASLLEGQAYVEEDAVRARIRTACGDCRVIHIAAHGEFRPDNPIFSGLALADGWLATLDIFDLQLKASLVTLSACQTGQSVVGGGDELQGLMRAFFYAGAASLILSLWTVEDRSTAQLMETFYAQLAEGATKAAALCHAQRRLLATPAGDTARAEEPYAHPYYWAPFFLVGEAGAL